MLADVKQQLDIVYETAWLDFLHNNRSIAEKRCKVGLLKIDQHFNTNKTADTLITEADLSYIRGASLDNDVALLKRGAIFFF